MSREWIGETRADGWKMKCDIEGCFAESDIRVGDSDMPLEELAAGWYLAHSYGDRCPKCVDKTAGGDLLMLIAAHLSDTGPGRPHKLMENILAKSMFE